MQHEYRVALTGPITKAGSKLVVTHINEKTKTGQAVWQEVPTNERANTPDKNHVQGVENTVMN